MPPTYQSSVAMKTSPQPVTMLSMVATVALICGGVFVLESSTTTESAPGPAADQTMLSSSLRAQHKSEVKVPGDELMGRIKSAVQKVREHPISLRSS